jgi:hypothetical protein
VKGYSLGAGRDGEPGTAVAVTARPGAARTHKLRRRVDGQRPDRVRARRRSEQGPRQLLATWLSGKAQRPKAEQVEACDDGSKVLKHGTDGEALTGNGGEQSEG